MTQISIVVCTYNRAGLVGRTLEAVLAQDHDSFEVVVVDDGSTDGTPAALAALADDRLRVVRQDNAGLSVARNTGTDAARGEWLVFLDDDDVPDPGWLAALAAPMDDPAVGITCCGSNGVSPDGELIDSMPPERLPQPFARVFASYRAGTFAVRAPLYHQVGGYLRGLGTSHQFELFIRLTHEAARQGLRVESDPACLLAIERRPVDFRDRSNPYRIYDATSWILARHPEAFAAGPRGRADFEVTRAAAAARIGAWSDARRHFWQAVRCEPTRRRNWSRLVLTFVPGVRQRVWNRKYTVSYDPDSAGIPLQRPDRPAPAARELFLTWGYQENPSPAAPSTVRPNLRLRQLQARLARKVPGLTVHQSDALEHAEDPIAVLHDIARHAGDHVLFVAGDPGAPLGPPPQRHQRRAWSDEQLRLLLRSTGFRTERSWHHGRWSAFLVRNLARGPADRPVRSAQLSAIRKPSTPQQRALSNSTVPRTQPRDVTYPRNL